jgi:hypothetical protein
MSRRFNFTGRAKILKEDVKIVSSSSDGKLICHVHLYLNDYGFPADALVVVEAARGRVLRIRHEWGLSGKASTNDGACSEFDISSMGDSEGLRFRVLVVEPESCRLLGSAEGIYANDNQDNETPQRSLLPIVMRDLHGGIWELDDVRGTPTLALDINLGTKQELKSSPVLSAILPGVIRAILVSAVYEEGSAGNETDMDSGGSLGMWLNLAEKWAGCPPPTNSEHFEIDDWAGNAVTGFCREKKLRAQLASYIIQED